jgi:hypothetical protein
MVTSYGAAVTLAKSVVSVGTNEAPKTTGPAAVADHEQVAMKGVAVEVAIDEQPVMVAPPTLNVTEPATLVVATKGGVVPGNSPAAPLNTTVGVVWATEAVPTPNATTLPRAMAPVTTIDIILFISILLLLR